MMSSSTPPQSLASCDENHGAAFLILGWILLGVAIIVVSLRLTFRHCFRKRLCLDDWAVLGSLIAGTIAVAYLTVLVNAGLGQHIYCLAPSQIPTAIHASICGQIFNILGIGLIKVSVCLTVLRLIDRAVSRRLEFFIWSLLILACLSHSAQIALFIVQCRPMRGIWDTQLVAQGRATCFSPHITYLAGYIGFGFDAFTDLACSAIPVFVIKRLQMSRRMKFALCFLMGLGSLTSACAIAKAITLRGIFDPDYTWGIMKPAVCTIIEHFMGIILVSLPTLRPIYSHIAKAASRKLPDRRRPRSCFRRHSQSTTLQGSNDTSDHQAQTYEVFSPGKLCQADLEPPSLITTTASLGTGIGTYGSSHLMSATFILRHERAFASPRKQALHSIAQADDDHEPPPDKAPRMQDLSRYSFPPETWREVEKGIIPQVDREDRDEEQGQHGYNKCKDEEVGAADWPLPPLPEEDR